MSDRKPSWMSGLEWQDRRDKGFIWCYRDQAWEKADQFARDRTKLSGRASSCRRSTGAASRH